MQIGLLNLGVLVHKKGITEPVCLIHETDAQYIVGVENGEQNQPIKVMKKYVTALLYHTEETEKGAPKQ